MTLDPTMRGCVPWLGRAGSRGVCVGRLWLGLCAVGLAIGCDRVDDSGGSASPKTADLTPVERKARDGPVRLTVRTDRSALAGGEQLTLTVAIEAERGVTVRVPEFEEILGGFLIVDSSKTEPVADDLYVRAEHIYRLEGVMPGEWEVPAITVEYTDDRERVDGSHETIAGSVSTEPIAIVVDAGLADVKGPETLPTPLPYRVLYWALGVVGLLVLLALAIRRWRRRERVVRPAHFARRVIAHEWALGELERLLAEDLIGQGLVQEFYYRINGLVRRYIEMRFGLMAAEQTSEEFVRSMQDAEELAEGHKTLLRRFTDACDPVKYAAMSPQDGDVDWIVDSVRRFIRETAARGSSTGDARSRSVEGAAA